MFEVGTKIVHPCYGAGTVVSIDTKRIGEREHTYYVIEIVDASRTTQVMVPVKRAEDMGLRPVGRPSRLRRLLARCARRPREELVVKDYRKRRAVTAEQLKSGSFGTVVDMVRGLAAIGRKRTLSFSDKARMDEGKQMLASELALSADEDLDEALEEVETHLAELEGSDAA